MYDANKFPTVQPREERKLERLARANRNAGDLSERFTGTVEETAELFNSEYDPVSEWGENPHQK